MFATFTIVLVVVAVVGLALSLSRLGWPFAAAEDLGRTGSWFDHETDYTPEQLPDGNANDAAIPLRPLRGRG